MRILIVAGVGAALALAACGGAGTPAPAATTTASAATAAPATAAPASAAPAQTAAAAPAAPAAGPARRVEITTTNDSMSITKLDVKLGERIEFVVKHTGDEKHNLVGAGEGVSLVSPDFDGGATINWTWTAPSKAGQFKFVCAYHPAIAPIVVTVK